MWNEFMRKRGWNDELSETLESEKDPNQVFTAFIPSAYAAQFPRPQQYEGQTVAVSGKIILPKGKPEIIVTSPNQLRLQ